MVGGAWSITVTLALHVAGASSGPTDVKSSIVSVTSVPPKA